VLSKSVTFSAGVKWILASLFLEGVMLSLLIWNNQIQLHNSLSTQTQIRLNESTTLLQSALAAPLVQMDYATAKSIMNETQTQNGIVYLIVLDRQNNRLIDVGWSPQTPLPRIEASPFSPESLSDGRFDTRIPINLNNIPLGHLALGLSTEFYLQARQESLERSLLIAFLELFFSAILLLSLNYWFSIKFKQLTKQAQAIAQGNYALKLSNSEHREYDLLVDAFNQMGDAISDKITQLESAHAEQQKLNQNILHLVNHDSLTGIASRYSLDSYLNIALHHRKELGLFLLDIDGFKTINDTFGHQVGDQLLKQFALKLQQSAPENAFVARLGGDEFVIVVELSDERQLSAIAGHLCLVIPNSTFIIGTHHLHVTSSIGYSRAPLEAKTVNSLLNQADVAMYQAKAAGKSTYRAYTPENL